MIVLLSQQSRIPPDCRGNGSLRVPSGTCLCDAEIVTTWLERNVVQVNRLFFVVFRAGIFAVIL